MADWYISSVTWTAIPTFAVSTAYTVGQFVRALTAPAFDSRWAFRCTVAGTSAASEPAWPSTNNGTVVSGGATFQNVTGQSAYGWSAAAGSLYSLTIFTGGRISGGDRGFVSSDHSETGNPLNSYRWVGSTATVRIISVNRAGSVPPVAADVLSGAALIYNAASTFTIDGTTPTYWQGVTFNLGGTGGALSLSGTAYPLYFKNCAFVLSTSVTSAVIQPTGTGILITLDNCTMQFNNAGQRFLGPSIPNEFRWINTPAATLGTVPTVLFAGGTSANMITCRGVDFSAITTTLVGSVSYPSKILFDSCRIAPGVARTGTPSNGSDEIELVNCYDGSNFLAERRTPAGDVTTEFTITLAGGAQDNVGFFSHKMVTRAATDSYTLALESFWMDVNNATIGGPRTASVEVTSSVTLNTDEISLLVEYEGTSGSSLASFATSLPATPVTTPTAVPTSTATWNSLPATPVKQLLSVTFTPRTTGRVRAQVRLGKPSTTVYIDPRITLT